MTPTANVIVSQAEFARLRGVSRATVTHWKNAGRLLLNTEGKVDVDASEKLLALRPAVYRGGRAKPAPGEKLPPILDQSPEEIADSTKWTLIEAQRVKEIYLASLRKQEFETEEEKLVEIEAVAYEVEREYSIVRERLLSIPGKVSASLAGCDRAVIEAKLRDEIAEALAELSAPAMTAPATAS
jgi:phage terminase Nu1 subunit (DNA packaging protein)